VAVTIDRATGLGTVYVNGLAEPSFPLGSLGSLANDWPILLGATYEGSYRFRGRIDEVEIFRRALTPTEIDRLWIADGEGKCRPEPGAKARYLRLWITGSSRTYGNLTEASVLSEGRWLRPVQAWASEQYSNYYAAWKAVDGRLDTHWFGTYSGSFPKWIAFDLGQPREVEALRIYVYRSDAPETFDVEVSDDGARFRTVLPDATVPRGGAWVEIPLR
jgi:hypothetical protein